MLLAYGLGTGLTYGVATSDLGHIGELVGAALAFAPALWVLVGFTFALIGVVPRASIAAWTALVVCLVIGMFGQVLDLPHAVEMLSPFQHVPAVPARDFEIVPIAALTTVAAGLMAVGFGALRWRDVGIA